MGELSVNQTLEANLPDWRLLATELHARFLTKTFATGAALVAAITEAAEAVDHHPDITLTYPWVDVRLMSHDVSAITDRDIDLADQISRIAKERQISADPSVLVQLDITLDSAAHRRTGEFWAVVLTGTPDSLDGRLISDPQSRVPRLRLRRAEQQAASPQRLHVDLWVPRESLRQRTDAALGVGGTVVEDSRPTSVVLADPEGNTVRLCTPPGRD